MSRIYFTSDTHFSHEKIIEYSHRPFTDTNEMNVALIDNWNSVVTPDDTVYHLGDFAMSPRDRIPEFVSQLNGNIILIKGNHDYNSSLRVFENIKYRDYIEFQGKSIELIHNPYRAKFDADYVLCGHVHEQYKIAREGYQLKDYVTNEHKDLGFTTKKIIVNVGVDVWNYTPVTLEQIFEEIENAK